MSRVGKKPIPLPSGVSVNITPEKIDVKGPKGALETKVPSG
ncbi:MAG TPA: 50S ribosomal protein L6, partial [Acidobacteriota bacterium]|nr:50S ribosomal protein L6 [Acidobacteriota bacterium]